MSRTDKDTPHWVRAEWYEPEHHNRCPYGQSKFVDFPCDLPAEPVQHPPRRSRWRHPELYGHCTWEPQWDYASRYPHGPDRHGRHLERRLYWHGPQRRLLRDQLGRTRQEWNGSGGTDVEPDIRQHRHSVEWDLN